MELSFTKMMGSGNDFIVIDNRDKVLDGNEVKIAQKICQRKFSVGADGLLLIENSEKANFRMRIFNPDGSEPEMCGNGARCVALYASHNYIASSLMNFETVAGIILAQVKDNDTVKITLGKVKDLKLNLHLKVDSKTKIVSCVNTGVPHVVIIEESVKDIPVNEWGVAIRFHREFYPQGTNVDFIEIDGENRIKMRTYERGVEKETLACGTGAVASAVIAHLVKKVHLPIQVLTQSGEILTVYLKKNGDTFETSLEGRVSLVYQGKINVP